MYTFVSDVISHQGVRCALVCTCFRGQGLWIVCYECETCCGVSDNFCISCNMSDSTATKMATVPGSAVHSGATQSSLRMSAQGCEIEHCTVSIYRFWSYLRLQLRLQTVHLQLKPAIQEKMLRTFLQVFYILMECMSYVSIPNTSSLRL